ncbi:MAG TPA: bacterial transcriptional activator domain-containing protein [bacterium]|nr:bacterial transcriptional activator domain-containing protein [bacterium]
MADNTQPQATAGMNQVLDRDPATINIVTLGDFDILCQGKSLLTSYKRSYRVLQLLHYLITFRNQNLLPEAIIDDLSPDGDFADPKGVLRTQVFRVRKLIRELLANAGCQQEPWLDLTYTSGYYRLKVHPGCQLDIDMFEKRAEEAGSLASRNDPLAMDLYQQALALYKGRYLASPDCSEWLLPYQSRYHRLYLRCLFCLLELLTKDKAYKAIIEVYEQAVLIEPYNESLHLYFLQALLELGEARSALSHYGYITSLLYRELGVKPSIPLRGLYRQLQKAVQDNHETDLILIERELMGEDNPAGAFCCDADHFSLLCQLEKRKHLRTQTAIFLGVITITNSDGPSITEEAQAMMEQISQLLTVSLRQGDVFSIWNANQVELFAVPSKPGPTRDPAQAKKLSPKKGPKQALFRHKKGPGQKSTPAPNLAKSKDRQSFLW